MKAILKILLFLLTVVILCQCEKDSPDNTFPDINFYNALIEQGVDTNGDSIISPAEAEVITSLNVSWNKILDLSGTTFVNRWNKILDLTGIEVFVNLKSLDCSDNLLTSLDVSNNTALERLVCSDNLLTSLDVSNCSNLQRLKCGLNQLTSLNVSNNTALKGLDLKNIPSLYQVCVLTIPFPTAGVGVDTTDSPNVYFTTDCN